MNPDASPRPVTRDSANLVGVQLGPSEVTAFNVINSKNWFSGFRLDHR